MCFVGKTQQRMPLGTDGLSPHRGYSLGSWQIPEVCRGRRRKTLRFQLICRGGAIWCSLLHCIPAVPFDCASLLMRCASTGSAPQLTPPLPWRGPDDGEITNRLWMPTGISAALLGKQVEETVSRCYIAGPVLCKAGRPGVPQKGGHITELLVCGKLVALLLCVAPLSARAYLLRDLASHPSHGASAEGL